MNLLKYFLIPTLKLLFAENEVRIHTAPLCTLRHYA